MRKNYFIGLCSIILASCSTSNDDLQNFDSKSIPLAQGFKNTPTIQGPLPRVYGVNQTPNAIYGFYSSHTNKHLYSPYKRTDMLPRTQPGAYYYELDRFLGCAAGTGQEITGWFNEYNEDYVLTTNPAEFNGQNGWRKNDNIGNSYNGNEPGSYPVYRYFRNSTKSHFYTRDKNELGDGKDGFVYEGVAFYLKESAPKDYRIHDGTFYQDNNTNNLYIVYEGQLRLIETIDAAKRIFNFEVGRGGHSKADLINKVDINAVLGTRGPVISANSVLYEDVDTGIRYFDDRAYNRGNLRKIQSELVFKVYNFNEKSLIKTTGVGSGPRGLQTSEIIITKD
ncbi:hypothetical protein [Elizabethkingia ursingii]|uniref:DUF5648 domain-containing protein n=1 Tax=Elizabethkingia ursingii TaxID=1756150 RepID=A0ABX3NDE4_9FLAO|nr:hypothetical protein [Elizabethkingia ursingii]OPB94571.1 hypothetical protein BB021_18395 [Elizabethkingia ursingii]